MEQPNSSAADAVASSARAEAARRNGAKSKGPKTEAGKQRSSLNAVKHGLHSRTIVLPGESQDDHDALRDSYRAQFAPVGPAEGHDVDTMVAADWRISRIRHSESELLARRIERDRNATPAAVAAAVSAEMSWPNLQSLGNAEARLQRDYDRALRRLLDLQKLRGKARPENRQNEPSAATAAVPEPAALAAVASGAVRNSGICEPQSSWPPSCPASPSSPRSASSSQTASSKASGPRRPEFECSKASLSPSLPSETCAGKPLSPQKSGPESAPRTNSAPAACSRPCLET